MCGSYIYSSLQKFNICIAFIFTGEAKGKISIEMEANASLIKAVCLPFISMLYAIGNPAVDYFSLDIEGVELDVLKTIPWDTVDIKVNFK